MSKKRKRAEGLALDSAIAAMLDAAAEAGFPPERVVIGITAEHREGGVPYQTHVGRTVVDDVVDRDHAVLLQLITKDLAHEASEQAQSAFGRRTCPECGSPRVVTRHRRESGNRLPFRDECMDCDYHGPDR